MSVKPDCIEMSVGGLTLDPVTKTPIVILKDTENKLNLPIWIGLLEATAMATEIEGIAMARPMTHDLLKTLLAEVGGTVQSIEITELKENTYYAAIHLSLAGGRQVMLDSRPSDAIALALRAKCPIFVAKAVLEASSVLQQDENKETPVENVSNVSQEKWGEILEKMTPDDFKYKQ
ncbi:MAG TPA: bifunctional nuclease family protein [Candidatus Binatia bacterium]|nr:bifunctional nuclease family protein [Candidatus Binatia bacterium]